MCFHTVLCGNALRLQTVRLQSFFNRDHASFAVCYSILFIVLMALSCNSHYEGQSSFLKSKVSVFIISPFLLGDALIVSAVNSIWAKQITKCELRQVSSYSKLSTFELRLKLNWVEQWVNSSLIEAVCTAPAGYMYGWTYNSKHEDIGGEIKTSFVFIISTNQLIRCGHADHLGPLDSNPISFT